MRAAAVPPSMTRTTAREYIAEVVSDFKRVLAPELGQLTTRAQTEVFIGIVATLVFDLFVNCPVRPGVDRLALFDTFVATLRADLIAAMPPRADTPPARES